MKWRYLIAIALLLTSGVAASAQNKLTDAEVQQFFALIRQTKEFKDIKAKMDSLNIVNKNSAPQELNVELLKQDDGSESEIFWGRVDRSLMGLALETYTFSYDRSRRQIISVTKRESRFKIE